MPLCYEMLTLLPEILLQIKNDLHLVFVYTNFSFSVSLFTSMITAQSYTTRLQLKELFLN